MPMEESEGLGVRLLGGRECGAVAFAGFGSMGRWVSVSVCTTVFKFKWAGLCRNYRG